MEIKTLSVNTDDFSDPDELERMKTDLLDRYRRSSSAAEKSVLYADVEAIESALNAGTDWQQN
jgi:hypothetical protein